MHIESFCFLNGREQKIFPGMPWEQEPFPVSECYVASFEEEVSKGDSDRDCNVFSGDSAAIQACKCYGRRQGDDKILMNRPSLFF